MSEAGIGRRPPDGERSEAPDDAVPHELLRREREKADADIRELQRRLVATRTQLSQEHAERQRLASQLAQLRQRRSVRLAVALAQVTRPVVRLVRRVRVWRHGHYWRWPNRWPGRHRDRHDGADPFAGRVESLFGRRALDRLDPDCSQQASRSSAQESRDRPLVSIIMVIDDTAESIEASVESVVQQTYSQWELIVCVSRDGPLVSALPADDARLSVQRVRSPGAGAARNKGMGTAGGEMIAYLDPPNLWHPQFLQALVGALVGDGAHYAAVCDHFEAAQAGGSADPVIAVDPQADYAELVSRRAVAVNAVVHRRELYDEIGRPSKAVSFGHDRDLLTKYLFIREPRRVGLPLMLRQQGTVARPSSAGTGQPPDTALLRTSAERYIEGQLPRRPERRRPALTVVGGAGGLAHEKAWDLVAAASGATRTRLVSPRCSPEATYAPRFVPAVEAETVWLEEGRFPAWASTFARGVANVHGDVVYAAEPRLPSLGLAMLASHHYGIPVIADLSHAPTIDEAGRQSRLAWDDPLGLDDVDPSDAALLDPHSEVWDRLMAGVARALPVRAVDSVAETVTAIPDQFVVPHPKDEAVFDPRLYDRDLARHRLGLDSNSCVLLCSVGQLGGAHDGRRPDILEDLATRFQVLVLRTDPGAKARDGDPWQVIDRNREDCVAAAMAASDAVLLWVTPHPQTAQMPSMLPAELGSALAMQVPVIANDVGELGDLGHAGYVGLAPFGDVDGVTTCLQRSADGQHRSAQAAAARHLFMRRFSHASARVNVSVILRLVDRKGHSRQAAEDFARFFGAFYRHVSSAAEVGR